MASVFVRIYNEQPTFALRNPREFTKKLLDYIGSQAQFLWSAGSMSEGEGAIDQEKLDSAMRYVCLALESLRNVLRANQGVELECNGHFKLLFSLLKQSNNQDMQLLALQVINAVTSNKECVKNIAGADVIVYLLFTLHSLPTGRATALETLHSLVSNNKCIAEIVQRGGLIYLLEMFCNSGSPAIREDVASLFAKMLTDKLHGPKIRLLLQKFLPPIFMEAVRDNAEASVTMFEGKHENPELIWNEESRSRVQVVVKDMRDKLFSEQQNNPELSWRLPPDFGNVYESMEGEVVVGGVFLRLLIKQPNWSFRKPREFLTAIMVGRGRMRGAFF